MKRTSILMMSLLIGLSASFSVQASTHGATQADEAKPAESAMSMSEGEIRKIDKGAGKITIKHGELKNLDMPPMTMVFRVQDPAMLDQVKVGDKVDFVADKVGGQFTVMKIEPKK